MRLRQSAQQLLKYVLWFLKVTLCRLVLRPNRNIIEDMEENGQVSGQIFGTQSIFMPEYCPDTSVPPPPMQHLYLYCEVDVVSKSIQIERHP